jgi:hypothetical protein
LETGVDASRPSSREAIMIIDIECPFCNGAGRVHSSARNGDPMDSGEDCPRCGDKQRNERRSQMITAFLLIAAYAAFISRI